MKGILGIIAALSLLLALFVSRDDLLIRVGLGLLLPIVGGCGGYLIAGRSGVGTGTVASLCLLAVALFVGLCLYVLVALFTLF